MGFLPPYVENVLKTLENAGFQGWCAGGAVRDTLLGRTPDDWDVTTDASPAQVMELFGSAALPTGLQHGTVTVGGEVGVEVTTFRRDGPYLDNRHPDSVQFTGSLVEDLARRDFTVNAMALNLRGEIVDPFAGRADLKNHVLRAVGEPEMRFQEDALRIMRGLRFAAKLGFDIEPGTANAIHICGPLLEKIAVERILVELTGMLCGSHVLGVLLDFPDVLGVFMPEILPCVGFDQHSVYHCFDVWQHTAHAVASVRPEPVLRFAMLLHDLGKPETFFLDAEGRGHFYGHWRNSVTLAEAILDRLKMDARSKRTILTLVERHDAPLALNEKAVRRNLARYGEETLRLLLEVKRADNLAQAEPYRDRQALIAQWEDMLDMVIESGECFSLRQLAVKGGDLMNLGLRGPEVGKMLNNLLEAVIEEKMPNDRDMLLDFAKELMV